MHFKYSDDIYSHGELYNSRCSLNSGQGPKIDPVFMVNIILLEFLLLITKFCSSVICVGSPSLDQDSINTSRAFNMHTTPALYLKIQKKK